VRNKILGKRYATALLDIASADAALVEEIGKDLKAFAKLMVDVPEVRDVLTSPLYPREFREKTLEQICRAGGASELIVGFFRVLLEKGRFEQFDGIVEAYQELLDERRGRVHATLVTASPLPAAQAEKIQAGLARKLGKGVVLATKVDPTLLGGVRAEIGSLVIDGSLRSQLNQIKDRLVKG
jgi:F-type H+-transporting ATPase subunit delta